MLNSGGFPPFAAFTWSQLGNINQVRTGSASIPLELKGTLTSSIKYSDPVVEFRVKTLLLMKVEEVKLCLVTYQNC